jgi:YggT family protein
VDPIRVFLVNLLLLYSYLLFGRIVFSWFPGLDWFKQPWKLLYGLTEPVMAPFRRMIPPLGGFDFSPIILFFVLNLLINLFGGRSLF